MSMDNSCSSPPAVDKNESDKSVVTPFLVKHISDLAQIPNHLYHQYCYRHNPDVTANKLADEKKMKNLQSALEKLPGRDKEAISHVWSIFSAAPQAQRRLILSGILSQCCFPTLSFVSSEVSSLIKIDFISALPVEISLKILSYLDCASLCNAAQVSRKWKSLADDDRVWHHMCEQHIDRKCPNCGWGLPLMHMKKARENIQNDIEASNKRKIEEVTEGSETEADVKKRTLKKRPWKSVYSERYKLEKNWRKGVYSLKTFKGHDDGVTCLQFNRKYLMTGSYDATIKIWNIDTGECIRTLAGHTKGIRTLVFDSQKLISAGLDSTIKVWNYHTGQCISTYRGHDDSVNSVDFLDKTIVSGSADHTVKVWHVDSRTCYTLRGHTDWVNCVKIHAESNTAFSASDDTTVRMWDLETHKCLRVLGDSSNHGHIGQVQCVIPFTYKDKIVVDTTETCSDNEDDECQNEPLPPNNKYPTHLVTSSLDNTIKLWDLKTGKCVRTSFGHIEGVWSISADNFRIISGAHDRLIKVWDLQDGKCLHTFGNDSSVSCVALSDSRFAAGLENGLVKISSGSSVISVEKAVCVQQLLVRFGVDGVVVEEVLGVVVEVGLDRQLVFAVVAVPVDEVLVGHVGLAHDVRVLVFQAREKRQRQVVVVLDEVVGREVREAVQGVVGGTADHGALFCKAGVGQSSLQVVAGVAGLCSVVGDLQVEGRERVGLADGHGLVLGGRGVLVLDHLDEFDFVVFVVVVVPELGVVGVVLETEVVLVLLDVEGVGVHAERVEEVVQGDLEDEAVVVVLLEHGRHVRHVDGGDLDDGEPVVQRVAHGDGLLERDVPDGQVAQEKLLVDGDEDALEEDGRRLELNLVVVRQLGEVDELEPPVDQLLVLGVRVVGGAGRVEVERVEVVVVVGVGEAAVVLGVRGVVGVVAVVGVVVAVVVAEAEVRQRRRRVRDRDGGRAVLFLEVAHVRRGAEVHQLVRGRGGERLGGRVVREVRQQVLQARLEDLARLLAHEPVADGLRQQRLQERRVRGGVREVAVRRLVLELVAELVADVQTLVGDHQIAPGVLLGLCAAVHVVEVLARGLVHEAEQ